MANKELVTCSSCGSHKVRVWTYESVGVDWDSKSGYKEYLEFCEKDDQVTSDIAIYLQWATCRKCNTDLTTEVAEALDYPMWKDPIGLRARLGEALYCLKGIVKVWDRSERDVNMYADVGSSSREAVCIRTHRKLDIERIKTILKGGSA